LTEYRTNLELSSGQDDGVISKNTTPDAFLAPKRQGKDADTPFDLLAIGTARVAAEAVRSEDSRPWNLFVPRTMAELRAYEGDSFVDAIVLAGDEQVYFPVSKSYSFLHEGGMIVHQIPPHIHGQPIYATYQRIFGKKNVRTEFIHAGSRIIVAVKEDQVDMPTMQSMPVIQEEIRDHANLNMDYHYLTM